MTGGTGSGKGIISEFLKEKGAYIIDADKIAHDVIMKGQPAYNELIDKFGKEILDPYGEINRKKLGEVVFAEEEALIFLNNCTHDHIFIKAMEEIGYAKKNMERYNSIVFDAPLLFEQRFLDLCDTIWVVFAEESVRLHRIMQRDGISYEYAKNRIDSQGSWEAYQKVADVVIDNTRDLEHVKKQVEHLYTHLLDR